MYGACARSLQVLCTCVLETSWLEHCVDVRDELSTYLGLRQQCEHVNPDVFLHVPFKAALLANARWQAVEQLWCALL